MFALVMVSFVILLLMGGLGIMIANWLGFLASKFGNFLILFFILACLLYISSEFW